MGLARRAARPPGNQESKKRAAVRWSAIAHALATNGDRLEVAQVDLGRAVRLDLKTGLQARKRGGDPETWLRNRDILRASLGFSMSD